MGSTITFDGATGFLAGDSGPAVLVIQEWWGLVPQIEAVCERYAAAGFTALAPDFYGGRTTTEPDEAGKLMMELDVPQAMTVARSALDLLASRSGRSDLGVSGYCMGGGLALLIGCAHPDVVKAVVPYYGLIPWPGSAPDYGQMAAAVQGHFAELDEYFSPAAAATLEATLRAAGREVEMFVYRATHHAFANDVRPEVFDAAATDLAWQRTTEFFRRHLVT